MLIMTQKQDVILLLKKKKQSLEDILNKLKTQVNSLQGKMEVTPQKRKLDALQNEHLIQDLIILELKKGYSNLQDIKKFLKKHLDRKFNEYREPSRLELHIQLEESKLENKELSKTIDVMLGRNKEKAEFGAQIKREDEVKPEITKSLQKFESENYNPNKEFSNLEQRRKLINDEYERVMMIFQENKKVILKARTTLQNINIIKEQIFTAKKELKEKQEQNRIIERKANELKLEDKGGSHEINEQIKNTKQMKEELESEILQLKQDISKMKNINPKAVQEQKIKILKDQNLIKEKIQKRELQLEKQKRENDFIKNQKEIIEQKFQHQNMRLRDIQDNFQKKIEMFNEEEKKRIELLNEDNLISLQKYKQQLQQLKEEEIILLQQIENEDLVLKTNKSRFYLSQIKEKYSSMNFLDSDQMKELNQLILEKTKIENDILRAEFQHNQLRIRGLNLFL